MDALSVRYDAEKIADYAEAMSKRRSGAPKKLAVALLKFAFAKAAACTSQPAVTRAPQLAAREILSLGLA